MQAQSQLCSACMGAFSPSLETGNLVCELHVLLTVLIFCCANAVDQRTKWTVRTKLLSMGGVSSLRGHEEPYAIANGAYCKLLTIARGAMPWLRSPAQLPVAPCIHLRPCWLASVTGRWFLKTLHILSDFDGPFSIPYSHLCIPVPTDT